MRRQQRWTVREALARGSARGRCTGERRRLRNGLGGGGRCEFRRTSESGQVYPFLGARPFGRAPFLCKHFEQRHARCKCVTNCSEPIELAECGAIAACRSAAQSLTGGTKQASASTAGTV